MIAESKSAVAIRHVPFEDLGIIEPLLGAREYRVDYLDAGIDPIVPQDLLKADLLVILGGPIGVYEAHAYPFLRQEIDAAALRIQADRPTLGVCLGAQIMAVAGGAGVEATGRKEIGFAPLDLTIDGGSSPLRHLGDAPVLHWHGDEFRIPAGASRLAETPGFPNQAFSLGKNVLGLQFHLEADHRQIERWLIGHAHELSVAGIDPAAIREDAADHGPELEQASEAVFADWLDSLKA